MGTEGKRDDDRITDTGRIYDSTASTGCHPGLNRPALYAGHGDLIARGSFQIRSIRRKASPNSVQSMLYCTYIVSTLAPKYIPY